MLDRETFSDAGRCDLLCVEQGDAAVVIESQFGTSDLDHAMRLLGYVLEHDAAHGVMVAESYPERMKHFFRLIKSACPQICCLHLLEVQAVATDNDVPVAYFSKPQISAKLDSSVDSPLVLKQDSLHGDDYVGAFITWIRKLQPVLTTVPQSGCELWVDPQLGTKLGVVKSPVAICLPARPSVEQLVEILEASLRPKTKQVYVVIANWQASVKKLLAVLLGCLATAKITIIHAKYRAPRTASVGTMRLTVVPTGQLAAKASTWERQRARRIFWAHVAKKVVAVSNQQVRKQRALGAGSRGLLFGLGRRGIRMAVLYLISQRGFCVEIRIHHANHAQAANQFEQLRAHRARLNELLADKFDFDWAKSRLRVNEQVLRLRWRKTSDRNPYADLSLADELGDATASAWGVFLPIVRRMESFRW